MNRIASDALILVSALAAYPRAAHAEWKPSGPIRAGWRWRRVADLLTAEGPHVFAPTLTGLGEREHLCTPEVGIETHVQDLLAVLRFERLDDVVLVGHSYGGTVITLAADRDPSQVAALVDIDAVVLEDGACDWDAFSPERRAAMMIAAQALGGARVPVPDLAVWRVDSETDRAWLRACCTPHPLRPIQQTVRLGTRWQEVARKHYVLASVHPDARFEALHRRFASAPGWAVHEIEGGHEVMLSHPAELAELLRRVAA